MSQTEQLQVMCELTGEMAPCTICEGILLDSGERIGAIADTDMFAMFNVDMYDAVNNINKSEGLNIPLPNMGSQLWAVELVGQDKAGFGRRRGRVAQHNGDVVKSVKAGEDMERAERVHTLAALYSAGLPLFDDNDSPANDEKDVDNDDK